MTVQQWATTPADNNSSPPTGAPEGMAAAAVNNTMREMMASVAIEAQVNRVKYLNSVAGTNTITASMTPALTAYSAGMIVVLTPAGNNTGATTLNINGLGALDVQKADGDALISGDLIAGIPAVLVLDVGADDWILLNPQQSILGINFNDYARFSQDVATANTSASEIGFKGLPQNAQNGNYTCVLSDAGKHIYQTGAASTTTIPANASVAYPVGTVLTFVNNADANISIAITSDTLILAGTTTTGTRTLADNSMASALKISSTAWLISGSGLS